MAPQVQPHRGQQAGPKSGQQPIDAVRVVQELPAMQDGGWGWVVCFASFMCNLVLDGIAYSFGILLDSLVVYFDAKKSAVAWVGSLLVGIYMTSGPIVGGLVNKFGCRWVCISGAILSFISLALSTQAPNLATLMLTYGILGGFGLGLIYLPAVIACGYYFNKRRALATGISVCGSGMGCFVFAPLANLLLEEFGWKGANLIFAALCLQCAVFGALMRPLKLVSAAEPSHSLPYPDEGDAAESAEHPDAAMNVLVSQGPGLLASQRRRHSALVTWTARRGTAGPGPGSGHQMTRHTSTLGLSQLVHLVAVVQSGSHVRRGSRVTLSPMSRKDVFYSGSMYNLAMSSAEHELDGHRQTASAAPRRPSVSLFSRGSIMASHLSIPVQEDDDQVHSTEKSAIMSTILDMVDLSIVNNPLFSLIFASNILGFLAFYVPYMYLPDIMISEGISRDHASLVISMMGASNTVGRIVIGALVDLRWVSSLLVTNCSLLLSGICVFCFPFCTSFAAYMAVAVLLGLFLSAYISLTSIVLVDLLGVDLLTSSFGLLVLGRGLASMVGPPLAGLIYESTLSFDAALFMAAAFLIAAASISQIAHALWTRRQAVSP